MGYGSQWDMNFVHPVRETLIDTHDDSRDLQKIIDALTFSYSGNVFKRVIYTESHDEVANGGARVPEEIQPGDAESAFAKKRAMLGIVLILTAPGIPMVFQGQEFIEDEYFQDTEALDWKKQKRHHKITELVGQIIKLRTGESHGADGLRTQDVEIVHFNPDTKILAYRRGGNVLIVLNFSNIDYENYGIGIDEDRWKLQLNTVDKKHDKSLSELEVNEMEVEEAATDERPKTGNMTIPGYAALVFTAD